MPKYLTIPKDISFINRATGEPLTLQKSETDLERVPQRLTFREFFLNVLSLHPRFATTKGARALFKFEQAYDDATKGDGVMVLDEAVWKEFHEAAEEPKYHAQGPYGAQVVDGFMGFKGQGVVQLLPFIDAIAKATDTRQTLKDVDKVA